MVGLCVGALIIGRINDAFGRKFATMLSLFIGAIAQWSGGFARDYSSYVFTRFLAGIGKYI